MVCDEIPLDLRKHTPCHSALIKSMIVMGIDIFNGALGIENING